MSNAIIAAGGLLIGTIIATLAGIWAGRNKSVEDTRAVYVSASDMVLQNMTDEINRLTSEMRSMRAEMALMRAMIRDLGGDPRDLPTVRWNPYDE